MPIEQAVYFTDLDAYTLEDPFFIALRSGADAIYASGIERVGDLIAMMADEAAARTGLTPAQMHKLSGVLERMGLHFGSDVSAWRRYRETVDADFRLRPPCQTKLPQDTRRAFEI